MGPAAASALRAVSAAAAPSLSPSLLPRLPSRRFPRRLLAPGLGGPRFSRGDPDVAAGGGGEAAALPREGLCPAGVERGSRRRLCQRQEAVIRIMG